MKRILFVLTLSIMCVSIWGQKGNNYIKPINEDGFIVDSIISLKGDLILYLRAGTEFEIEKNNVSYIEHSQLGRIDINKEKMGLYDSISIPEPNFNGEAYICNVNGNAYIKMEKAIGQVKTKDQLMGPEMKLYVKPEKSSVRVRKGNFNVILRVPNINDDPYSFVKISKFATSRTRKLSLARQNEITGKITYGGRNKQEIIFEAQKYGESSLLLTFDIMESGEYCISISNPNKIDSKLSVSCFGVDD